MIEHEKDEIKPKLKPDHQDHEIVSCFKMINPLKGNIFFILVCVFLFFSFKGYLIPVVFCCLTIVCFAFFHLFYSWSVVAPLRL